MTDGGPCLVGDELYDESVTLPNWAKNKSAGWWIITPIFFVVGAMLFGGITAGLGRMLGLPKAPLWMLLPIGCLTLGFLMWANGGKPRAPKGSLLTKLVTTFALYTLVWEGLTTYREGAKLETVAASLLIGAFAAVFLTFANPANYPNRNPPPFNPSLEPPASDQTMPTGPFQTQNSKPPN